MGKIILWYFLIVSNIFFYIAVSFSLIIMGSLGRSSLSVNLADVLLHTPKISMFRCLFFVFFA